MRAVLFLSAAVLISSTAPALAQSDTVDPFSGLYVGGSFGGALQSTDSDSSIQFDRNGDGRFGDTVNTAAGANAFSPGFCGGSAFGNSAAGGCKNDKDGIEYAGRVGFDIQRGSIVAGIVGELGKAEINDSVTAFSTTPASYTMTRSLRYNAALRARLGYAANTTLFYATGGAAYGNVRNRFTTTNTANAFGTNGNTDAFGYSVGGGVEQKIGNAFSIGLEALRTDLKDNDARTFVSAGTAPATNPFILGGGGTQFRRSDDRFAWTSIRAVVNFRF